MIYKCLCKHQVQDTLFGLQNRVFNIMDQKKKPGCARCTVCGAVKLNIVKKGVIKKERVSFRRT